MPAGPPPFMVPPSAHGTPMNRSIATQSTALRLVLTSLLSLTTTAGWVVGCASPAPATDDARGRAASALIVSPDVVISQVYGGGGNTAATFTHDFVELFNRGAAPVSLGGKSLQYASTAGNFIGTNAVALPAVTLQPGQHYLIQLATGGAVGSALPTPDFVTTGSDMLALANGTAKVAIVESAAVLSGCGTVGNPCTPGAWIDLVGYGSASQAESTPTPPLSNATAALRAGSGCVDTGDNGADFTVATPTPRNRTDAVVVCDPDAGPDASALDGSLPVADAEVDAFDAAEASVPVDDASADANSDAAPVVDAAADATDASPVDASIADAATDANMPDAAPASLVLLNEIKMNPPTTADAPWEYVELICTPDASLADWYFVAFEGDGDSVGPPGMADFVVDLRGATCGSNGIAYIKASQGGATALSAQSSVIAASFLSIGTSPIENATTSFALIHSPSAPIVQTADYDVNDDGTLELPSGATLVDGVATFDEAVSSTDRTYVPRLAQTTGAPDAATRFPGQLAPLSAAAWYSGDLAGTAASSVVYDSTNASANYPIDGALTPGAPNVGTLGSGGNPDGGNIPVDGGINLDASTGNDSGVKPAKDAGGITDAATETDAAITPPGNEGGKPIGDASRDGADGSFDSSYPPSVSGCACQLPASALGGSRANAIGALGLVLAALLRRRRASRGMAVPSSSQ